jgi:hypothetical protein
MTGARLAATMIGAATEAGAPTQSRLSRYPTRTTPAVPGHDHTRLPPPPAATSPPWPTGEVPRACGLDHPRGHVRPSTGNSQAGSRGVAAAETVLR